MTTITARNHRFTPMDPALQKPSPAAGYREDDPHARGLWPGGSTRPAAARYPGDRHILAPEFRAGLPTACKAALAGHCRLRARGSRLGLEMSTANISHSSRRLLPINWDDRTQHHVVFRL